MKTVIFGYGNPGRGDDALGPLLLEKIREWPGTSTDVFLVADYQLQIEHAEDLRGQDLALFLDADASCSPPFRFRSIQALADDSYTTHELSPQAVLHVYRQITGLEPPPSFVLSIRGQSFELGHDLTPAATANLQAAMDLLQSLLVDCRVSAWQSLLTKEQP